MLNKLQIIGRVGRDSESKFTPSGQQVTSFSVATSKEYTNKNGEKVKSTVWIRVETWGKLAEICASYVKKGMLVYVEGELKGDDNGNPRVWTKSDGTAASSFEVNAQVVKFLSKVEGNASAEVTADESMPF